ncbi:Glycosyltransferase, catalytic subunit of cellulose synthase and poly-beta-1,6-N-acetylglucosamine synthase [Halpernia humi]|uniref:Glycosyltransferase, catalytic subunit of cellulose synthase and poly-beta-1,6-N-acetylglucosamine synthase n=1 Tax=Halpernia humi TaxID=493375 RepID=A0A1H5TTD2_9FLAO|nr:polysaccharide deacetylase family protein [Halpernia humi]SEF65237.1 Glycosyltransferase, catalytic subunit of cellulose synthase and poly-beta-1,6-N-acetylglucosamine synthase [Halpernia humi]
MSDNGNQVFQTLNNKRYSRTKWTFRIISALILTVVILVIFTVIRGKNPSLPQMNSVSNAYKTKLDPNSTFTLETKLNKKFKGFKDFLNKRIALENSSSKLKDARLVRGAFYVPWSPLSLSDLRTNGNKLNTIYPEWFFINPKTYRLDSRIDKDALGVMKHFGLSIQPILNNFISIPGKQGNFSGDLIKTVLHNPKIQDQLISDLIQTIKKNQLQGINIDFEEMNESSDEYLNAFSKKLYLAFKQNNLLVSIDVMPDNSDYNLKYLKDFTDYFIVMAYDQYNDSSQAGPISSQKWIEKQMDDVAKIVPSNKIILGVAGYGRQWITDSNGTHTEDITYSQAVDRAKISKSEIDYDDDTYNLHYDYNFAGSESDDATKNSVWFTDAATTYNILRYSDDYRNAGTALWRLGSEDPRIWNFYMRDLSSDAITKKPFNYTLLTMMPANFNAKPTSVGSGEILNILYSPQQGRTKIEIDKNENLISEEHYTQLPSGFLYEKFAEDTTKLGPGHKIILTFDDGPSAEWTPKILDILEREKIPATFFLIGENAEANIPLVQRINRDGFEFGNHTFTHGNLAKMSPERADLELKTTRSLLECITGKSTILFRAPYNADSEPQTYEELEPIARSKSSNYITVGESIDPNDWDPRMNADSIVNRTIRFANQNDASIILLHDSGGETRQPTVDALPRIIKYFKSRGCKFTTIADLMHVKDSELMPPVARSWKNNVNFIFVSASYWLGQFIYVLFLVGIFLSIARMVFMGILAYLQSKKEKKSKVKFKGIPDGLKVSVIVPAFNEEINAVRTVNSLLKQDYKYLDIVFVDDGSKDATFENVKNAFAGNEKVKVLTKINGGKASALNYGISHTNSEFVVCIDADTQLKEDAVSRLMDAFYMEEKPQETGAVAGNVKVGNEVNMITKWQSIEYITSQNFDRRAFGLLNCITVVPGAIGAFRRKAVIESGGFTTDTLAEDCDLTMRLHKAGYIIANCNDALSFTEAPETINQFLKQRFRWSFGILQSFWKHRDAIFRKEFKNFGRIALPNILLYQILLPFLAPLADLLLVISLILSGFGLIVADPVHIVLYYIIFSLVDILGAAIAFAFEREDFKKLIWMIPQRLVYRQMMYYILFKSIRKALKGEIQNWGVLKRTGNNKLESA